MTSADTLPSAAPVVPVELLEAGPARRHLTVGVPVGRVMVGGGAPVVVQSMTNTDTADIAGTVRQVAALARAGSEIVRITVDRDEAAAAVPHIHEKLLAMGARAVLMKGGHASGPESVDLLIEPTSVARLAAERFDTRNTHGTGCTLSSAIAAGLAKGLPLADAVRDAKAYITAAIKASDQLKIGHGHGPVHHFHAWW